MGTTLGMVAVRGGPDDVRATVLAYARARGFEPVPRTLPRPDPAHERVAIIAQNEGWTVLAWDPRQEQDRLAYELRKLDAPVLELEVEDSDAWAWRLWKDGRWVDDDDIAALCAVCGADPSEVERAQRRRGVFAEDTLLAFGVAIGVFPAGKSLDAIATGSEALRFRRSGWEPMGDFDVRAMRFVSGPATPVFDEEAVRAVAMAHVPLSTRLLLDVLRIFGRPITWLIGMAVAVARLGIADRPEAVPWRRDGDRVRNDVAGLSIALPPGAEPARMVLGAGVLEFLLDGDLVAFDTVSAATARRAEVFGIAGTTHEVRDLEAGPYPARRVLARFPDDRPPTWSVFVGAPGFVLIGTAVARSAESVARLDAAVATIEVGP